MFHCQPSRRLLQRANSFRTCAFHPSTLLTSARARPFSSAPSTLYPRKDSQDKDSLNPRSTEYSKTGTDDAVAENPDAAFNPNKTRPEQEKATSEKESGGGDPLDVSPGNKEASKPRDEQEGGPTASPRTSASGGGSAPKAGGSQSG